MHFCGYFEPFRASGVLFYSGVAVLAVSAAAYYAWGRNWAPSGFGLGIALLVGLPLLTPLTVSAICSGLNVRGFGLRYSLKSLQIAVHGE